MGPTSISETVHTGTEDQSPLRAPKVKYWQGKLDMLGEQKWTLTMVDTGMCLMGISFTWPGLGKNCVSRGVTG